MNKKPYFLLSSHCSWILTLLFCSFLSLRPAFSQNYTMASSEIPISTNSSHYIDMGMIISNSNLDQNSTLMGNRNEFFFDDSSSISSLINLPFFEEGSWRHGAFTLIIDANTTLKGRTPLIIVRDCTFILKEGAELDFPGIYINGKCSLSLSPNSGLTGKTTLFLDKNGTLDLQGSTLVISDFILPDGSEYADERAVILKEGTLKFSNGAKITNGTLILDKTQSDAPIIDQRPNTLKSLFSSAFKKMRSSKNSMAE